MSSDPLNVRWSDPRGGLDVDGRRRTDWAWLGAAAVMIAFWALVALVIVAILA